jgi:preprotein translocase subunit SecE
MARNRQRAKQRQAERRAARQAERASAGSGNGPAARDTDGAPAPDLAEDPALAAPSGDPVEAADLAAGAPPQELGHPEEVLDPDEVAADEDELDDSGDGAAATAVRGPRGVRGGRAVEAEAAPERERGRVVAFLAHVWAELQRVQWPDRRAMTTLTGVVLGFVLLAGGYLGLLDAIFSRIIQAIL